MELTLGHFDTVVEVSFQEYNHKTKKSKQVERTVTSSYERAIFDLFDSTDSGEFLCERVGDVTLSGYATFISEPE